VQGEATLAVRPAQELDPVFKPSSAHSKAFGAAGRMANSSRRELSVLEIETFAIS
jgi:hypothetical protein